MKVDGHATLARIVPPASLVPRDRDVIPPVICVQVVVESQRPPQPTAAVAPEPPPAPAPREVYLPLLVAGERPSVIPPALAAAAYSVQASMADPVQPRRGLLVQRRA